MWLVVLRRLAMGVVTLWVVTVLVFVGTEILPGDVAEAILGQSATPEAVAAIREQLNLDRPAVVRYADWLGNLLQGDLGISLAANIPISEMISGRLKNTLILAALTAAFAVPLSLALGLAAAMFPGGRVDRFVTISTLFLLSVPEFFIAAALVLIFAVQLQWLPAITSATEYDSVWQLVKSLALPILTLAVHRDGDPQRRAPAAHRAPPRAAERGGAGRQRGGVESRLPHRRRHDRRDGVLLSGTRPAHGGCGVPA
jgi:peptide/nickel transport system permease protein